MIYRLQNLNVIQCAIVSAILYGILSIVGVLFMMPFAAMMPFGMMRFASGSFLVFVPLVYFVLGFAGGAIFAVLYNLIARWTGGFEFTLNPVAPPVQR